jgi:Tol biopolymer transport system component
LTQGAAAQTSSGRIAFSAPVTVKDTSAKGKPNYTTHDQIFSMNPDGTQVEQLTNSSTSSSAPRWSPNRQYVLFNRGGALYVMEASGEANGGRTFLAVTDVAGTGSDWSPDGTMICFPWYGQGLGIVNVDAATGEVGEPTLVWEGLASFPSWSPDETKIAFSAINTDTGAWDITVLDLASGSEFTFDAIPSPVYVPHWSPDGSRISFTGYVSETINKGHKTTTYYYAEIFIADAEFSEITQVTNLKSFTTAASWSADGTELAFMSDPSGTRSIYTMSLDTGELTLLWTGASGLDWTP